MRKLYNNLSSPKKSKARNRFTTFRRVKISYSARCTTQALSPNNSVVNRSNGVWASASTCKGWGVVVYKKATAYLTCSCTTRCQLDCSVRRLCLSTPLRSISPLQQQQQQQQQQAETTMPSSPASDREALWKHGHLFNCQSRRSSS